MRACWWAALPATVILLGAPQLARSRDEQAPVFQTSDRCIACHNGLFTSAGEDISIGVEWRAGMMANSSRDPYWQAGVRREIMDHPSARAAIEDECSVCHMPMARYLSKQAGGEGEVFAHLPFDPDDPMDRLAADGVSCSLCHQISPEKLGARESFVGRFVIGGLDREDVRPAYGPFEVDAGRTRVMRSSSGFQQVQATHIRESEMCATCHTLYTKALGPQGQVIGELPEQVPYQEWLHSSYKEMRSCQDCHMPVVKEPVAMAAVLGKLREGVSRHTFLGGNFFMLRMLNRFRGELGVEALPQELEAAAIRTVKHLQSDTARLRIEAIQVRSGRLETEVSVENLGGHKLPTAYPSRRVWLRLIVRDGGGKTVFESGALRADGSIVGNDNDADPKRYESHYTAIHESSQVQIYEDIMGDMAGLPTTGLLSGVRYLKDNRLLPQGFDKRTAHKDIAVLGGAATDDDFTAGGDHIRYSVPIGGAEGPFQVEAELWYQPISFRWASNLRQYQAMEPQRFIRYFDSMSSASAVRLAAASASR
jgi:hypothetical protein